MSQAGFPGGTLPEITPAELHERMERGERLILVDVREPGEKEIADLPEVGQLRIPVGEILDRLDEVDPNAEVILYCRSGSRSAWATRHLLARGFTGVRNLKGGLLRWKLEVDPSIEAY